MNAEKAAYFSPVFSQKRQRTLEALLRGLHTDRLGPREVRMPSLDFLVARRFPLFPLALVSLTYSVQHCLGRTSIDPERQHTAIFLKPSTKVY